MHHHIPPHGTLPPCPCCHLKWAAGSAARRCARYAAVRALTMCSFIAGHVAGLAIVLSLRHNKIAQGAGQLGLVLVVDPFAYIGKPKFFNTYPQYISICIEDMYWNDISIHIQPQYISQYILDMYWDKITVKTYPQYIFQYISQYILIHSLFQYTCRKQQIDTTTTYNYHFSIHIS